MDSTETFAPERVALIYRASDGTEETQPAVDVPHVGTLIDPENGDDLPVVGLLIDAKRRYSATHATSLIFAYNDSDETVTLEEFAAMGTPLDIDENGEGEEMTLTGVRIDA